MSDPRFKAVSASPLASLAIVALDLETTGLDPVRDRIVQIGAVRVRHGIIHEHESLDQLLDPQTAIPEAATAIHGIADGDVAGAPTFSEFMPELARFLDDDVILGHNIGFDLAVLAAEHARAGHSWRRPRSLDTALLARIANPLLPAFELETVAEWLGLTLEGRHTALGDALAAARIFLALLPHLRTQGVRTLGEAERALRGFGDAGERQAASGWLPPVIEPGERLQHHRALVRLDSFAYRHRVADVMTRPARFIAPDASLAEAARQLIAGGVSALFVEPAEPDGAFGIVTERDLMRQLGEVGSGAERRVAEIMSAPLKTVAASSFLYRAVGKMARFGIRHLGVVDEGGRLAGALSSGDLVRERARDALVLGYAVEHAQSVHELGAAWARLPEVARALLDEETGGGQIAAIIAEELRAVTARAGELALAEMARAGRGAPPVPFVLLVLGSAGRGETLLAPDQDNALIYADHADIADPSDPEPEGDRDGAGESTAQLADMTGRNVAAAIDGADCNDGNDGNGATSPDGGDGGRGVEEVDAWFAEFASRVAIILDEAGIPYCPGGVMARNRAWRQSLSQWKATVANWLRGAKAADLLNVDVFFDFAPVLGDARLAGELWQWSYEKAHTAPGFLREMAAISTGLAAPIGLFGRIRTEEGRVNVKKYGLRAIASGARLLALRYGLARRSTRERLEGVQAVAAGEVSREDVEGLIRAQEILLTRNLAQQIDDIGAGIAPSNRVDVKRLPRHHYQELKWALAQIEVLNSLIGDPRAFG